MSRESGSLERVLGVPNGKEEEEEVEVEVEDFEGLSADRQG